MLIAFCVNIAAPGNWIRQGKSGEIASYGVIGSILKSFVLCMQDIAGDWTGIFWDIFDFNGTSCFMDNSI